MFVEIELNLANSVRYSDNNISIHKAAIYKTLTSYRKIHVGETKIFFSIS